MNESTSASSAGAAAFDAEDRPLLALLNAATLPDMALAERTRLACALVEGGRKLPERYGEVRLLLALLTARSELADSASDGSWSRPIAALRNVHEVLPDPVFQQLADAMASEAAAGVDRAPQRIATRRIEVATAAVLDHVVHAVRAESAGLTRRITAMQLSFNSAPPFNPLPPDLS
jgi:hypothetical protein